MIRILETKEKIPMELLLLADPSEDLINEYLPKSIVIAAKEDDTVVGVLVLLRTRPKTMEIMNVSVQEEFQNKGIGRNLILHAIEYAKKDNCKTLEIGTGNPGVVQMLLYQKCGFRIMGVDFDYFTRNYATTITENGIVCRDMIRMKMDM